MLTQLMEERGYSNKDLAQRIGVAKRSIKIWKQRGITRKWIPILAEVFEVSEDVFKLKL